MDKVDYLTFCIMKSKFIFLTLKIEEIGKQALQLQKVNLIKTKIEFKNIFRAEPPIDSGYHFGSRLVIKENHLYISAGERGQGMIAQDPTQHPGSIIRINLDGSIPKDNPKFKNKKDWLPEIFQIGVRNPQGMSSLSFLIIKYI